MIAELGHYALMLALGLALWSAGMFSPFLLASLGGSAVFLFGLTRAPAAQPRALIGGHLGGALIGSAAGGGAGYFTDPNDVNLGRPAWKR